jgi:serine/threonine protein kinase
MPLSEPFLHEPEQARGDTDIDGRSDIYALEAILFEMLTGKQPYQATTPMGIVMKHITEPVPRILDIRSDLPSGTESVITRAMAKKRDERFSTARDMAAAQEAVVRQQVGRQAAPTTVEKVASTPAVEKPPKAPKNRWRKAQPGKTPGEVPPVSGKPLAEKIQAERRPLPWPPPKRRIGMKPAVEKEHGESNRLRWVLSSTGVSRRQRLPAGRRFRRPANCAGTGVSQAPPCGRSRPAYWHPSG